MSRAETHKPRGVDLSGGKCLGELVSDIKTVHPQTICWACAVPVGKCNWLLEGVMPEGGEYYRMQVHSYGPGSDNEVYIMRHCPHHERAKRNDE